MSSTNQPNWGGARRGAGRPKKVQKIGAGQQTLQQLMARRHRHENNGQELEPPSVQDEPEPNTQVHLDLQERNEESSIIILSQDLLFCT